MSSDLDSIRRELVARICRKTGLLLDPAYIQRRDALRDWLARETDVMPEPLPGNPERFNAILTSNVTKLIPDGRLQELITQAAAPISRPKVQHRLIMHPGPMAVTLPGKWLSQPVRPVTRRAA